MGCCGGREKFGAATNEQRWDFINLSDFKSSSCWTGFSYGLLYFFLIISIAVYIVDIYTASNLLFFDRWSSQVQPAIPIPIARWVFAGCIFLSWILLAYRWWRARKAMKSGIITASYLDPLAVRIESIRMGKGQGWRRFLVFTALTKGRKGSEYVALFTYFSFEAWLRIIFAEGPRQVINALTLYSVLQAKLIPTGEHAPSEGHTAVVQFFVNVRILANSSTRQATILFGMLYVLIVWVFTAISLILAFIMYITFLWHHIPTSDGSLSKFCQRKIEKRLGQIVHAQVDKAIAKEHIDRVKKVATGGAGASVGMPSQEMNIKREPTVPMLDSSSVATAASLSKQTTSATDSRPASPFGTRPASPFIDRPASPFRERPASPSPRPSQPKSALSREPMSHGSNSRPELPSRHTTQSSLHSDSSYASDTPLMGSAAGMGSSSQPRRPPPPGPSRKGSDWSINSQRQAPYRSYTPSAQSNSRAPSAGPSRNGTPFRANTPMSSSSMRSHPQIPGRPSAHSNPQSPAPSLGPRRPPASTNFSRRPTQEFEMHPPTPLNGRAGSALPTEQMFPSHPGPIDYFGEQHVPPRAGTAPAMQTSPGYDDSIYDAYGARNPNTLERYVPPRPDTTGPGFRPARLDSRPAPQDRQAYNPPKF